MPPYDVTHRTPEMITEPDWIPVEIWILGWSKDRSEYFIFEPESTVRSVHKPFKNFKRPIKISTMMLAVVKQNGIN